MGYTIKIVRELNISVIMQYQYISLYQSHTPDAKKNICPLSILMFLAPLAAVTP